VYAGTKSYWREEDALKPVNGYGQTKVLAEERIKQRWTNFVILRSSIIFGALPPLSPITRGLFVQWMDGALAGTEPVDFFNDEYRNPIFVGDILTVIRKLCELSIAGMLPSRRVSIQLAVDAARSMRPLAHLWRVCSGELEGKRRVYNMGGPERLSRVDMAKTVCGISAPLVRRDALGSPLDRHSQPYDPAFTDSTWTWGLRCQLAKVQGYDARLINSVPSASAVGRVPSPADISMDVSRLTEELGIHLTPFEDALRMTFHKGA
jgi:dTDP-4-dehydrorhamnose reductase